MGKILTHNERSQLASKQCTASDMTFGNVCLNCGYNQPTKENHTMRNEQWTLERNNEATVKAYKIAIRDGAVNLAENIKVANPQIPWLEVDAVLNREAALTAQNVADDNLEAPEQV